MAYEVPQIVAKISEENGGETHESAMAKAMA